MAIHRGLINVSTITHATTTMITFLTEGTTIFYTQRVERSNTFQPRAIRGSYNPRYYNSNVEKITIETKAKTMGFKNSIPPPSCIINTCSGNNR